MSTRMSMYNDEPSNENTRYHKNEELYRRISSNELDNFEVKSNATVLGEHKNEIDIEKIKKILDTKYNETPKRQSIRANQQDELEEEKEITKEYDINIVLEKAKEQKTDNYEEERLKKLRDTQFDILKNLNLDKNEEEVKEEKPSEDKLKDLINTIALNEKHLSSVSDSLDILSDLKGSDDTEVLDGLKEEIDKVSEETKVVENNSLKEESKTEMINSFYTSSNALNQKDFDDMEDFSKSIESSNTLMKVIITIVVIIFLVGIGLLVKAIYFK